MGTGEGEEEDRGWSLFVGRADGRVEAHRLWLDEGSAGGGTDHKRKGTPVQGVVMSPQLEENVLCFAIDTFGERLYAGGDGGVLRCWEVRSREEVVCLGEDSKAAAKAMRAGSFAAYDVAYYDPHEEKARREKWVERRNNEYLEDAGRGNLVVGNLNGGVVIWDLEARAVSALLLGEEGGDYDGAVCAVAVAKGGYHCSGLERERIVGLVGNGRKLCLWDSLDVWDAVPEVENSAVVKFPVRTVDFGRVSFGTLLLCPGDGGGGLNFAVGSKQDPLVMAYSVGEAGMGEARHSVLSWNAGEAYTLLDDTEPEAGGGVVGSGGASASAVWLGSARAWWWAAAMERLESGRA